MLGNTYDEGFTSSSLGEAAFGDKEAVLHLRVPAGTPARYMDDVAYYPTERELLLERGTK